MINQSPNDDIKNLAQPETGKTQVATGNWQLTIIS